MLFTVRGFLNDLFSKTEEVCVSEEKQETVSDKKYAQGDIVYALMPLSEDELETIPYSHRHRPYVVASCEDDHVIAYECSSKDRPYLMDARYQILSNRYNVWKDGYVYLNRPVVVPFENICKKLDVLKEDSLIEMNRIISGRIYNEHPLPSFKTSSVLFHNGDIVRRGSTLYYINDVVDDKYCAYALHQKNKTMHDEEVMVHDKLLHFSRQDQFLVSTDVPCRLVSVASRAKRKQIADAIREWDSGINLFGYAGAIAQ